MQNILKQRIALYFHVKFLLSIKGVRWTRLKHMAVMKIEKSLPSNDVTGIIWYMQVDQWSLLHEQSYIRAFFQNGL